MDNAKCNALKAELASQPKPRTVPIERFFGLLRRPDVKSVDAQIAELDPGAGSWPFTDTVLVVGAIPVAELRRLVRALQPDEVGTAADLAISPSTVARHGALALALWWD